MAFGYSSFGSGLGFSSFGGWGFSSGFNYGSVSPPGGNLFGGDLYGTTSSGGSGSGGGFWDNIGDSLGDFFTEGETGEAVDQSAAALIKGGAASLLETLGVKSGGASSSQDQTQSGQEKSSGMGATLRKWAGPALVIGGALLLVEVFASG
jgi:hypothetical protein